MSETVRNLSSLPLPRLPWPGRLLLRLRFRGEVWESVIGDLVEEYHQRLDRGGDPRRTRSWFRRQVFASLTARSGRRGDHLNGRLRAATSEMKGATGSQGGKSGFSLDRFRLDLTHATRIFRRRPLLAVVIIITLAVGIGANALIFSIFSDIFIKPLPYPDPQELVCVYRIEERVTGLDPSVERLANLYAVPYALYLDWQELGVHFTEIGAYSSTSLTLTGEETPERLRGSLATSGVFGALGIEPVIGRWFLPEDDEIGADPAVILSYRSWQHRFGGQEDVLGRSLTLNGAAYTVVGVMPEGFYFPDGSVECWVTFRDDRKASDYRPGGSLQTIARLRSGVDLVTAQSQMDGVARQLGELHPAESEHGVRLVPRHALTVSSGREQIYLFLGAAGIVLLIACANIAGLLLVRAMERRRELAVRSALGAGRSRIITQVLSESLLLALAGGTVGMIAAMTGLRPFLAAIPGGLPRSSEITVDFTILLLAVGFSLLTALLTGLIPALRSSRTAFHEAAVLGTARASGGRRTNRTQSVLVVAQVALAFTLLATTGLLTRSYLRLNRVDLGFDTDNLVVTRITLPDNYRDSEETLMTFFDRALVAIAAIPGVEEACVSSQFPYIGGSYSPPAAIETPDGLRHDIALPRLSVSPGFFEVMDLSILRGRKLSIDDVNGGPLVAVVNETFARRAWPDSTDPLGTSALGARIQVPDDPDPVWITVVGIAEDFRFWHGGPAWPLYFMPSSQDVLPFQTFVVRTAVEPSTLIAPIRSAIWDLDRDLLVEPSVLADRLRSSPSLIGVRFGAIALGLLATIAGLLALMGIYGLLAFTISRQAREIGIRIAIGARLNQIVRGVVRRGLLLSGIGLATGFLLTLAIGQLLRNALFEVRPTDAISLGLAGAIILFAALLASLLPARRVVRIDPVETLRRE